MTDEQREKRMAELLWSCDSYEEMCQRVVGLEAEMERLREKDRNQRKQLMDVQSALEKANDKRSPWRARAEQAEMDNARLRELVSHLYECMCNVDMDGNQLCDSCEYNNTEGKCDFEQRMRELGIEDA